MKLFCFQNQFDLELAVPGLKEGISTNASFCGIIQYYAIMKGGVF